MKVIILVDGSDEEVGETMDLIKTKYPVFITDLTQNWKSDISEYDYLLKTVYNFTHFSSGDILLVRFSGKEEIPKRLGDECTEMILSVSYDKESSNYTNNPKKTFLELIKIFNKENEVNVRA